MIHAKAVLGIVFLIPCLWFSEGLWTITKSKGDIVTYIGKPTETGLQPTKSEMTINADMDKVIRTVLDIDGYTKWVPYCDESHRFKQISDTAFYLYQRLDVPILNDRDIAAKVTIQKVVGTSCRIRIVATPDAIKREKDVVRIEQFSAEYIITRPKGANVTRVVLVSELNVGGNIPVFLLNWANQTQPYETFSNLRNQILEM